jgi:hypothetical protein
VKTGVQLRGNELNLLDSGACPGPDPVFAGMTNKGNFGVSKKPSHLIFQFVSSFEIRISNLAEVKTANHALWA